MYLTKAVNDFNKTWRNQGASFRVHGQVSPSPLPWPSPESDLQVAGAASVLNGMPGVFCVVCRGSQGSGPQGISGVTLRTTKGLGMALALCARLLIERLHGMVTAETMRQGTHCCRFPWGDDDMQSNPSPSSFIIFLYNSFSEHQ